MKIKTSEFIISAVGPSQFPADNLPEVALAGRSNVGKSSLINKLLLRRNLARTSSQPGKTQTLNYYKVNGELYFVDVPGYGYARVAKTQRQSWGKMIENYIMNRGQLRLVIQLVDLRHPPSAEDRSMFAWLAHHRIPLCVVGTKSDKVAKPQWHKHMRIIRESLGMAGHVPFVPFSSETGHGRDELWRLIREAAGLTVEIGADAGENTQE